MFNLNKKNLIPLLAAVFLLFFLSASISIFRIPGLNISKFPLSLVSALQREIGGLIFYHRNLQDNEIIRKENDFLRHKLNGLNEIYLENRRLNNLLSLKQKSGPKFIPARVIARPADNWSTGLVIDKGAVNGVRKGMAVVTYLGLAGRVVEAADSTSKIMLLNDPNMGVSSLVQRSRQEGLVCGTLGSNLLMKYLPEDADIRLKDIIVTSGLNDTYPKGLLIGTVVDIGKEFSGLSRFAVIKPAINFSSIEEILIVAS
ncbi:MAG: rod shape-determining protein MreC [Candidatus Omnitrophica bacterium]|nr:rod shape-determining protein MreC [Candidatus Omnitrophota bacterium]